MSNTNTHTHTHTHSVLRDTQGGLSLGQGSDTILTHAGWPPLIKLMGYEHREDAVGGAGNVKHTHTYTVFTGIHRVDGTSGKNKNRTQS